MLFSFAQIHGQYHAMCTDRWGDVYFAARNRADTLGRIDKYNNNGVLVVSWVLEREGGPGYPKCLAVDNEGNVYATDNEGVDIFAPTSTETVIE
jgi:sugar lactone lactonase YvrE